MPILGVTGGGNSSAGGGGGGFDPLSIGWAHAYWTEGPEFVALGLADGAAVSSWPDEAGTDNLAQGTAANKPTYRASSATWNNKPIVEFDGTNDQMMVGFTDLSQPNEIVAVARHRVGTSGSTDNLFDGDVSTARHVFFLSSDGRWHVFAGTDVDTTVAANTSKHLFRVEFNTTASKAFADEVQLGGTLSVGTHLMGGLSVGARYDSLRWGEWDVIFVGISDSALTTQQRADLHTWSQSTYGTA